MKQRILALFLALCLCLPLAACGKKQGYDPLEGVQTRVVTDSRRPPRWRSPPISGGWPPAAPRPR